LVNRISENRPNRIREDVNREAQKLGNILEISATFYAFAKTFDRFHGSVLH